MPTFEKNFIGDAINEKLTETGGVIYLPKISVQGELASMSRFTSCLRWPSNPPPWTPGPHVVGRYELEGLDQKNGEGIMTSGIMFAVITENYIFHGVIPRVLWKRAFSMDGQLRPTDMRDGVLSFFVQNDGTTSYWNTSPQSALSWCQHQVPSNPTVHGVVFLYPSPWAFLPGEPNIDPTRFLNVLKNAFREQLALSEDEFEAVFKQSTYESWTEDERWKFNEFEDDDSDDDDEEGERKYEANKKKQAEEDARKINYAAMHIVPGDTPRVDVYKGKKSTEAPPILKIPLPGPCD